jgi:hypothetical protein
MDPHSLLLGLTFASSLLGVGGLLVSLIALEQPRSQPAHGQRAVPAPREAR